MCLLTPHQYHTVLFLHHITQICLRDSHTMLVTFKHHDVLISVVLNAIREPQDRPVLYHFLFSLIREMRLPLRTASAFELAPQSRKACKSGVALPSFFSGPGILPMRCRNAARLPELPDFSGALATV